MVRTHAYILTLGAVVASLAACAQTQQDHLQHHPANAATVAAGGAAPRPADRLATMDQHMKAMQTLREKLAAATTPQERQALMAEHAQLMQEGMALMGQMRGMMGMQGMQGGMQGGSGMAGNMAERQQMMEKRMDMMESMLQMMMDRLPPAPANR